MSSFKEKVKKHAGAIAWVALIFFFAVSVFSSIEYIWAFESAMSDYVSATSIVITHVTNLASNATSGTNIDTTEYNLTKFYALYFSLNRSELDLASQHIKNLIDKLNTLSHDLTFSISFLAIYLIFFYGGLCKPIRRQLLASWLALGLSLWVAAVIASSSSVFSSITPVVFVITLYSLTHLIIPSSVTASLPEILVFTLDLTLFLIVFLSEYMFKFSENLKERIDNLLKAKKGVVVDCPRVAEHAIIVTQYLDIVIYFISTLTKIMTVIILVFSISLSILAYYNEVFLALATQFIFGATELLVGFVLVNLGLDLTLYLYFKAMDVSDILPKILAKFYNKKK